MTEQNKYFSESLNKSEIRNWLMMTCRENIARGTTDPWVDTNVTLLLVILANRWRHLNYLQICSPDGTSISWIFGHQVAPLTIVRIWPPGALRAIVGNLAIGWRHLHWHIVVLCWYLHESESHQQGHVYLENTT